MCPVCRGRGEVAVGITSGVIEHGPVLMGHDWRGNPVPTRSSYPTRVVRNPDAIIRGEVWYLETNPFCEAWGIAICGKCRGSGGST